MKLVTFDTPAGERHIGALLAGEIRIADFTTSDSAPWSRGSSGEMHHKFEDILAHVSRDETIHPGEFFGSGTVGGGCGLEQGRFLKMGDTVELEITGLGRLVNRVVASTQART